MNGVARIYKQAYVPTYLHLVLGSGYAAFGGELNLRYLSRLLTSRYLPSIPHVNQAPVARSMLHMLHVTIAQAKILLCGDEYEHPYTMILTN